MKMREVFRGVFVTSLFGLLVCGPVQAANLIGTSNLADGAVTNPKLAAGAVTDDKISGTISGAKLGPHAHYGSDLVDASVTGAKLSDGAVSDSKIIGPISAGKIATAGLNADLLDGQHASAFADTSHGHIDLAPDGHGHDAADLLTGVIGADRVATYAGIKVVHKGPADNQNTFNDLTLALQSITDSSELNPYAILLMPGVYEVDYLFLNKPHVDLIGSGRRVTILKALNYYGAALYLRGHNTLRHLTVQGQMEGVVLEGDDIEVSDCTITALSHVVVVGAGGSIRVRESDIVGADNGLLRSGIEINGRGVSANPRQILVENVNIRGRYYWAILGFNMTDLQDVATFRNVTIDREAYNAVYLESGIAEFSNVTGGNLLVQSRNGIRSRVTIVASNFSSVQVNGDCTIDSSTVGSGAIFTNGSAEFNLVSGAMFISNSKLTGSIDPYNLGGVKLINCYDGSYDSLPNGNFHR